MKFLKQGLCLGLLASGLAVSPVISTQAGAAPAGDDKSLLAQAKKEADGSLAISKESATGKVGFIRTDGDLMPSRKAESADSATAKADAYLGEYAALVGAADGQLQRMDTAAALGGGWTVSYQQTYKGVAVFGGIVKAHLDGTGDLTSVNGFAAPGLDLDVSPRRSAAEVGRNAIGLVTDDPTGDDEANAGVDTSGLTADADLVIYRTGLVKGDAGDNVLAYSVNVTNGNNINDQVFLDANTGKLLNRYSKDSHALDRELLTVTNDGGTPNDVSDDVRERVWQEGDPFPGVLATNQDQLNLVQSTGESYWMMMNTFGRDSFNGAGHRMTTVHNRSDRCPNASWNGVFTSYCPGVYSDDVVSHEWGHAYTEYTSGLIYQWQSGALNESYSDVWGETLDLLNNREDAGEGDQNIPRTDGHCSRFARGPIDITINSPDSIAGECASAAPAAFGPVFPKAGVTADMVVGRDAANPAGPTTTDGCTAYTNAAEVAGKWVYVDRGTCPFVTKVLNAQDTGATGIILGDNQPNRPASSYSGGPDAEIYGAMVSQADGTKIKSATGTVNVTVKDIGTDPVDDSVRWSVGEQSTAFGGAIRDMWNPTCYGDPGKVSDVEYNCDKALADAGGVHGNSGVPNHLYALVVDGGTYNGQAVGGMGIDQAANLWWKVGSEYLTPQSDFGDMADGLEAACAQLIGQPIKELSLQANTPGGAATPITATDCADLGKAIAAVELRQDPVQCDYQPLFDPNTPSLCGEGFTTDTLWSEDFEDGLAGWGTDKEIVYTGGSNDPWVSKTVLGNASKVAFGPATDTGACSGGAGDASSRDSITSELIDLPTTLRAPTLSFQQSIATEGGVDGGNVKISVNGRAFQAVPSEAYLFNAPSELLPAAAGNTNPMAGEEAFTGTDENDNHLSKWGTSIVDLSAIAEPGDAIRIRLDVGRDGCGGNTGWAVDNLRISFCKLATKVTAVHKPEPSTFGQASTAEVRVARDGSTGAAPTGAVEVKDGKGKLLGTATLSGGAATVDLPADLAVGANKLTAVYSGSGGLSGSSADFIATVKSDGSTTVGTKTKAKVMPKSPKAGDAFKIKVKVEADDRSKPAGSVVVRIDGRLVGKAVEVENGKVTVKVKKGLKAGKHKLSVKFKGTAPYENSKTKKRFKVRR